MFSPQEESTDELRSMLSKAIRRKLTSLLIRRTLLKRSQMNGFIPENKFGLNLEHGLADEDDLPDKDWDVITQL